MFCCHSVAFTQDTNRLLKLQLAQRFEEAGEWERAVTLYRDLYESEPTNFIFLNGLQRSYTKIKEYDKAINIIHQWLAVHPLDINLMTTLGGLYFYSGNEATADSVWKNILSIDPYNLQPYYIVAKEMMNHRLYEQCIHIYLDGRSISKQDAAFADELGNIYIALQQFASATKEYLRLIRTTPDGLSLVQSRLSSFTTKPEALKIASEIIGIEVKTSPDNVVVRRLYAWLLMEDRNYDSALEQYRTIDHLSTANGNELYNFAQLLIREHAYKTAAHAFKEILDEHKNSSLLPSAHFGYARALEELSNQLDTVISLSGLSLTIPETKSQPIYQNVIQLYESIVSSHPNPDLIAQALFRIGIIMFEKFFDLDSSLNAFNRTREFSLTSNIPYEISLKIGDVQVAHNNLVEARKEYALLAKTSLVTYQDQAAFKLAELDYFEAHFDSALSMLKRFNTNLNTDLTNDALQLQYFIQENKTTSPQALEEFAKADLLLRQRKYSESLVQFQDIVGRNSMALLIDDAMMKIGELHLRLRQPHEALKIFCFIVDSIQLSILKDQAQFHIAEIYQSVLHNNMQATKEYEKLLAQFPNSLYVEEARKRIRTLRGDNL